MENSEIIQRIHNWRRQQQICQTPDLLQGVPEVAGSTAQEERDRGRLSAGREMPVIAVDDGEQEKSTYCCGIGK